MKKNGLVLLLLLAGVFWFVLNKDKYDRRFEFDGVEFELAKKVAYGSAANYFYTLKGEQYEQADEFIQLITFDDRVSEEQRTDIWNTLQKQYGLNALGGSDGSHGTITRRGVDIVCTGTAVTLDDASSYLVYIYRKDENYSPDAAAREARQFVAQLQELGTLLAE